MSKRIFAFILSPPRISLRARRGLINLGKYPRRVNAKAIPYGKSSRRCYNFIASMSTVRIKATATLVSLKAAVRRLGRALLGAWLIVGPFVGIYARDEGALVVILTLLAGAYGFVAGRCASEGVKCVAPILVDGAVLLAVFWIASASRDLFGPVVAPRLQNFFWAAPAVLLVCFWIAELLVARRHHARA